nr:ribonuclease H-like domain-containing protein [Tanacetum cinerariifolium]
MSYLSDFKDLNGGYVSFGGNPKGGKIFDKGKIRTGKLDFDNVYFVKELKFSLFSVSQMCDKKNSVLFTDTKCLVLSPEFKLPDENQVLLRVLRKNNMYNVNLKDIVPSGDLTCLFAKATFDESNLWHRRTLVEAARTMLADSLLPIPFWAEAVNTAYYVQNRVLVTKPQNKTPYELLHGRTPSIGFIRPFGCLVTILNTLDSLGKFDGKVDEGFLVGYSVSSSGPTWLFNIDTLTKTMNYQPVTAGNQSNPSSSGFTNPHNTNGDAAFDEKELEFEERKPDSEVNVSPSSSAYKNTFSVAGPSNVVASPTHGKSSYVDSSKLPDAPSMPELEDITYSDDEDDVGAEADFNNLETSITVSPIPTRRVHKDHLVTQIIGDLSSATQTRSMIRVAKDQGGLSQINNDDFHTCMFACFLSQEEPKKDPDYPDKVYKVVKALYGLHHAPRACLTNRKSASTPIDTEKPLLKNPDGVNTPRCDEDRLELTKLMVLLLLSDEKVGIEVCAIDLQVSAVMLILLLGVKCLPNEEIFTELARMGYEKPSTKLTFYKAFFSSQWKFLIHTILQYMSAKRTSCNEFSSSMASAVICLSACRKFNFSKYIFDSLVRNVDSPTKFNMYPRFLQLIIRKQVGDLSSYTTKYSSPALTQKVFTNMIRVGKGCSGVETLLFEGMIVEQPVGEGTDEVHDEGIPTAGVAAEGVVSVADDVVPTDVEEPSIPSPTPPTQPPPPSQDLPSTSRVQPTPLPSPQAKPSSPQNQPQPSHDAGFSIDLLQNLLDTYDTVIDDVSKQGKIIADTDADKDMTLKDIAVVAKDVQDAEIEESLDVLSMQDAEVEPVELQEVVEVVTTSKLITEVVTAASTTITVAAPQLTTALALTLTTTPSAARRRKGVKEDNAVKRYQALKRKPQTEAQTRKNIMIYLRYVAGFKMDYFKGMTYDDIRPIFEKYFNSNVAFLQKTKEQMEEEDSRALKRLSESQEEKASKKQKLDEEVEELRKHLMIVPTNDDDVYTEATPLALKVPIVDYEIYNENNKPYYKIKRADGSHQLYLSFLSMLRNFDREDLEVLWQLVKERFASTKPKNFSDDFLLTTLRVMFEKPDIQAQIWKNQRSVHGQAKVKSWKLLESCGVQIITFTTTQLILLVERRYPLTRFTLDQMLNNVRLKVEEESEVSLELLSFAVDVAEDFKENMLSDYCCQVKLMLFVNVAKSN